MDYCRRLCQLLVLVCVNCPSVLSTQPPPHIIFIVADDLGWNDVSWNNPDIIMPTLDKLARKGVILNSSYVQPICSPSRSSFLTGYYPYHLGMQGSSMAPDRPTSLPKHVPTLSETLRRQGYSTHMVGKWHLGFCNWGLTPTFRGFDSFYGFYTGSQDYVTHSNAGYDFRWNTTLHRPMKGRYSTSLFAKRAADIIREHDADKNPLFLYLSFQSVHTPLQISRKYYNMYPKVKNYNRRVYSGMITAMDEAVNKVTTALRKYRFMNNLVLVFTSDNGAASYIAGSNWPLRGSKTTLWEGGTRVPGFVYSKSHIRKTGVVNNELIHAVDWYPTLTNLARGSTDPNVDGIDQWQTISRGIQSNRTEFVYNFDEIRGKGAFRMGDYKLMYGSPGSYNGWYPVPTQRDCGRRRKGFGYREDEKLEQENLADEKRTIKRHGFSYLFGHVRRYLYKAASVTGITDAWSKASTMLNKYRCNRFKTMHLLEKLRYKAPDLQLYNIKEDPTETVNLLSSKPVLVKKMLKRMRQLQKNIVPAQRAKPVKWSHPRYHDGFWSPGWC